MSDDWERRWAEVERRMRADHRRDQLAILLGGAVGLLLTLVICLTVTIPDQSTAAVLGIGVTGACVYVAGLLARRSRP